MAKEKRRVPGKGNNGKNKISKEPQPRRTSHVITGNTNEGASSSYYNRKNTVKKHKDVAPGRTGRDRKVQRGKGR